MAEAGILKRAENAEAEVKDLADKMKGLEVELVSLRKQIAHVQESVAKKACFFLLSDLQLHIYFILFSGNTHLIFLLLVINLLTNIECSFLHTMHQNPYQTGLLT